MKKQKTLEWLVKNLDVWPKTQKLAPNIDGYKWRKNMLDNNMFLLDSTNHVGILEELTICQSEWHFAYLDDVRNKLNNDSMVELTVSINDDNTLDYKPLGEVKVHHTEVKRNIAKQRKTYIAGPMTGYDNFNRDAFNDAAHLIIFNGNVALNPATLPDGLSQADYMSICLPMLMCCDSIFMLEGWEKSEGAKAEYALAVKLGLEIL